MKRKLNKVTFIMTAVMLLSLAGCGSSSYYDKSASSVTTAFYSNGTADYDTGFYESDEMYEESADAGQDTVAELVEDTGRKLIKTYDLSVETEEFDELLKAIENRVSDLGGYIENLNTYNGSSYYGDLRYSNLTIRIPVAKSDEFINFVGDSSNVTNKSMSVDDITLTYVDLESKKEAYEVEQERLMTYLNEAETVDEMLAIEQQLTNVRYQLQSMESQLRTYDNQIDYTTISLYINEVREYTEPEPETFGQRLSESFTGGLENFVTGCGNFFVWFVGALPVLILLAVIIVAVILITRKSRKKRSSGKGKTPDKDRKEVRNANLNTEQEKKDAE